MTESEFWSQRVRGLLIRACRDMNMKADFERVENRVADGTPDVDYCIAGVSGKIELKYTPKHPVRSSTPVLGNDKGFRKSQIAWAVRRCFNGGIVFACIGTDVCTWFIDLRGWEARAIKNLDLMTSSDLDNCSVWATGKNPLLLPGLLCYTGTANRPPAKDQIS